MTSTPHGPDALPIEDGTRVNRYKWLQRTTRADLDDVLDCGLVAHVGLVRDGGAVVVPMAYTRIGDHIVMHGSTGAGLNRDAATGIPLTATITIVDGLVYAGSLFDSTINYRCAMIFGSAVPVGPEEKEAAIMAISHRLMPDRWDEVRPPTRRELAATHVLKLPLDRASVKSRAGAPDGDPVDGVWTGHLPLRTAAFPPVTQPGVDVPPPPSTARAMAAFNGADVA